MQGIRGAITVGENKKEIIFEAVQDLLNQLVEKNVDLTQRYLEAAQKKGYRVNMVTRDDLHILINAQMSCVFEMLIHNVPRDKAVEQAGRISKFFTGGWQKLIME